MVELGATAAADVAREDAGKEAGKVEEGSGVVMAMAMAMALITRRRRRRRRRCLCHGEASYELQARPSCLDQFLHPPLLLLQPVIATAGGE